LLAGILATYSVYTLGFDDQVEQQRLEAEGCEEIISAYCAEETRQWDEVSGKAWRYLLISGIAASFATLKFHWGKSSEEEEGEERSTVVQNITYNIQDSVVMGDVKLDNASAPSLDEEE
jgi:hypothetical protein